MAPVKQVNTVSAFKLSSLAIAGMAAISLLYFTDILLRASRKCFWFDELFTVYLCRLPTFHDTWAAVTHGVDFNPPLFYLSIRGAQRLFGDGLVATRLPSAIGVWLFCVCLFLFVGRRAGAVSGFIAGAFPFFTLAQYYSYEARAHGIVLGWLGLALLCWQRSTEEPAKISWSIGFGLSVVGALLTHIYAVYVLVPFAIVEIYNLLGRASRRLRVLTLLAIALGLVTLTVYLPLIRQYRAAAIPVNYYPASHELIQQFLIDAFGPGIVVFLLLLLFSAWQGKTNNQVAEATGPAPQQEVLLALAFVAIPLVGFIGCKISHGPFLDRYFLSSVAGAAILLGFATYRWRAKSSTVNALAGCMCFLMVADLAGTVYFSMVHRIILREPSTKLMLSTNPSNPMQLYESLSTDHGLDIMVLPSIQYLYFYRYAPSAVVSHLYFWAPANDVNQGGYEKLAKWAHLDLKITAMAPFLATRDKFLVYGGLDEPEIVAMQAFATAGFVLTSAQPDINGILYTYQKMSSRGPVEIHSAVVKGHQ